MEIVKNRKDDIESDKESYVNTVEKKNMAWAEICKAFNSSSRNAVERSSKQLRKCFENMKAAAKKADASLKREGYQTGGGPMPTNAEDLDQQMLNIMAGSIEPLRKDFDDDAS